MNNTRDLSTSNQLERLERLSAFLDGELSDSEFEAVLDCLDDEHCIELKRFQLISDVLRDDSLAISTSDLFSVRFSKALEAEATHSIDSIEWQDEQLATGTYGFVGSRDSVSADTKIQQIPRKTKTHLAFFSGGLAAAFATIMTYNAFQTADIQSTTAASAPVLASTQIESIEALPNSIQEPTVAVPVQSFSHAPAVVANVTANNYESNEEGRRTYPEYLRSHSAMSANTPFMQVNYKGMGVAR
ncbi:MAG: sigma-E factor negative regulatory protein [Alcaligenaceae bacterium]|jgi:negative regulator of sigma E activity|nr:sigma-E factor negative regulatory protein [Alcaligenaceae bacterium]